MSGGASTPPPSPHSLVAALRARDDLHDPRVEAAFLAIPRALFLPGLPLEQVYADEPIPIKRTADGTVIASSSQPSMMALMLEQLRLRPGLNVLEIGAGTGYNAALICHLVGAQGRVTSVEIDPQIADAAIDHLTSAGISAVKVVTGDGAAGFAPRASYDRIIATAGVWDLPPAWIRQLKPRGLLVVPLWFESLQFSAALELQADGTLYSDSNLQCGFVRLRGVAMGEEGAYRVGPLLTVQANAGAVDAAALHLLLSHSADAEIDHLTRLSQREIVWRLAPFLALHLPPGLALANYYLPPDQTAYGLTGSGIALLGRGSACFVPAQGEGVVYTFGASEALLALQDGMAAWEKIGRPRGERLRIRVTPREQVNGDFPARLVGRRFTRRDHVYDVWFDGAKSP